jgi:hypothetical protein
MCMPPLVQSLGLQDLFCGRVRDVQRPVALALSADLSLRLRLHATLRVWLAQAEVPNRFKGVHHRAVLFSGKRDVRYWVLLFHHFTPCGRIGCHLTFLLKRDNTRCLWADLLVISRHIDAIGVFRSACR